VEPRPRSVQYYVAANGSAPALEWLRGLRDGKGRGIIQKRLRRIEENGNFGVTEPVGEGVYELKIDFGPGYRVYYGIDGENDTVVVVLCGGDKDSQQSDIAVAKKRWGDYNA
jgi:putative addiction module killer protein